MGRIEHHAILITTYSDDRIEQCSEAIRKIYGTNDYHEMASCQWNGYRHILIPPDGSKEGWPESDAGDKHRARVIEWLKAQAFEDGSNPFSWVEVKYGADEGDPEIVNHS